jgi:hypothetical protein
MLLARQVMAIAVAVVVGQAVAPSSGEPGDSLGAALDTDVAAFWARPIPELVPARAQYGGGRHGDAANGRSTTDQRETGYRIEATGHSRPTRHNPTGDEAQGQALIADGRGRSRLARYQARSTSVTSLMGWPVTEATVW